MNFTPEVYIPTTLEIDMANQPKQLKQNRCLFYNEDLARALPDLPFAFTQADNAFIANTEEFIKELDRSKFSIDVDGQKIDCSLRYNNSSSNATEINVTSHGFSDYSPMSTPDQLIEFLNHPNYITKQIAQPNSWSPLTKAATLHDVRDQYGMGMPQLDIYRPFNLRYKHGDFSIFAKVVNAAIKHAQEEIHGIKAETQITGVHLDGISLGASEVIGAGANILSTSDKLEIKSVTAHELIMGLTFPQLLKFNSKVGEPLSRLALIGGQIIYEPMMRQLIDAHGNEINMTARMGNAMLKMFIQAGNGLPHFYRTKSGIEDLINNNVPVTVALAKNSYASKNTKEFLPEDVKVITIQDMPEVKLGHIVNEHISSLATVSLLGIKRAQL